jgi:hypothetical protein
MVCIACISVIGFLIALVAKFLGEFLGIGYFKTTSSCPMPKKATAKADKTAHAAPKEEASANAHSHDNEDDEDENPFAKQSAFEAGDVAKCPFSPATQGKTKKRE